MYQKIISIIAAIVEKKQKLWDIYAGYIRTLLYGRPDNIYMTPLTGYAHNSITKMGGGDGCSTKAVVMFNNLLWV